MIGYMLHLSKRTVIAATYDVHCDILSTTCLYTIT